MKKLYTLTHKIYGWVGFLVIGNIKAGPVKCLFNSMQNLLLFVASIYCTADRTKTSLQMLVWAWLGPDSLYMASFRGIYDWV